MKILDDRRKCEWEGCGNLGDIHKKVVRKNGDLKVYRRNLCTTHKRIAYKLIDWNSPNKMKKSGEFNKCSRCGWEGPCDVHRIKPGTMGGKYCKTNVTSLCPNCHRLFHRGLIEYMGYKIESGDNGF